MEIDGADKVLGVLVQGGTAGVLAYIVMVWKRKDDVEYRERLIELLAQSHDLMQDVSNVLQRVVSSLDALDDRVGRVENLALRMGLK